MPTRQDLDTKLDRVIARRARIDRRNVYIRRFCLILWSIIAIISLNCLVFDWILVNIFKVKVDHYFPLNSDVTVHGVFTVTSNGRIGVNKQSKLRRPLEISAHQGDASSLRISQRDSDVSEQLIEFGGNNANGDFEEAAAVTVGKQFYIGSVVFDLYSFSEPLQNKIRIPTTEHVHQSERGYQS